MNKIETERERKDKIGIEREGDRESEREIESEKDI